MLTAFNPNDNNDDPQGEDDQAVGIHPATLSFSCSTTQPQ